MVTVEEFIEKNNLFKSGEIVGIGVSGGSDSIALLHFLATNASKYDIEVVAIHVDHGIRDNSASDAAFVKEFAQSLGVRVYKFRIEAKKLAEEKGVSLETAGRMGRYEIFKTLLKKGAVDKIALAHHQRDQAETVLMHIFRGSGTAGARGMEAIRDGVYVRPMLSTSKSEILNYISENNLEYVEDYTNEDNSYSRNYVRNVLLPQIEERYPGACSAIAGFATSLKEDDDYISSNVQTDAMLVDEKSVRIPTSYFLYPAAIVSRMLFKAFKAIGITQDIERKHISAIEELALKGQSGTRVYLPFEAYAVKDYDYVTILNRKEQEKQLDQPFKCGTFTAEGFGKVTVRRAKDEDFKAGLLIDGKKLPKGAKWRYRADGDMFTKFGGARKKLKSYFIDIKVPQRQRQLVPVLALGSEIYAVAGYEVSDLVRVDENSTTIYSILVAKD